jgi:hypothetical protein
MREIDRAVPYRLIVLVIVRSVELLDAWQPTVIKGNAGEIGALAGSLEVCSSWWLSLSWNVMTTR